ncbi:unnamed protein product [Gongylonema pulchrum]|uniref:Calpastatin n=1 Tax=Gongylonema pulchrum TaxID=637853 RepID=A0A183CUU2_9BILA|nr:unnamed protein product [Gongylonema pulchrum]
MAKKPKPALATAQQPEPALTTTKEPEPAPSTRKLTKSAPAEEKQPKPATAMANQPGLAPSTAKQLEPVRAVAKQPEPAPTTAKQPEPASAATKQSAPAMVKKPKPTLATAQQPEPASATTKQRKPAPSTKKQLESAPATAKTASVTAKQSESASTPAKQSRPALAAAKQPKPASVTAKQPKRSPSTAKQSEPVLATVKQSEPALATTKQLEPASVTAKQLEPPRGTMSGNVEPSFVLKSEKAAPFDISADKSVVEATVPKHAYLSLTPELGGLKVKDAVKAPDTQKVEPLGTDLAEYTSKMPTTESTTSVPVTEFTDLSDSSEEEPLLEQLSGVATESAVLGSGTLVPISVTPEYMDSLAVPENESLQTIQGSESRELEPNANMSHADVMTPKSELAKSTLASAKLTLVSAPVKTAVSKPLEPLTAPKHLQLSGQQPVKTPKYELTGMYVEPASTGVPHAELLTAPEGEAAEAAPEPSVELRCNLAEELAGVTPKELLKPALEIMDLSDLPEGIPSEVVSVTPECTEAFTTSEDGSKQSVQCDKAMELVPTTPESLVHPAAETGLANAVLDPGKCMKTSTALGSTANSGFTSPQYETLNASVAEEHAKSSSTEVKPSDSKAAVENVFSKPTPERTETLTAVSHSGPTALLISTLKSAKIPEPEINAVTQNAEIVVGAVNGAASVVKHENLLNTPKIEAVVSLGESVKSPSTVSRNGEASTASEKGSVLPKLTHIIRSYFREERSAGLAKDTKLVSGPSPVGSAEVTDLTDSPESESLFSTSSTTESSKPSRTDSSILGSITPECSEGLTASEDRSTQSGSQHKSIELSDSAKHVDSSVLASGLANSASAKCVEPAQSTAQHVGPSIPRRESLKANEGKHLEPVLVPAKSEVWPLRSKGPELSNIRQILLQGKVPDAGKHAKTLLGSNEFQESQLSKSKHLQTPEAPEPELIELVPSTLKPLLKPSLFIENEYPLPESAPASKNESVQSAAPKGMKQAESSTARKIIPLESETQAEQVVPLTALGDESIKPAAANVELPHITGVGSLVPALGNVEPPHMSGGGSVVPALPLAKQVDISTTQRCPSMASVTATAGNSELSTTSEIASAKPVLTTAQASKKPSPVGGGGTSENVKLLLFTAKHMGPSFMLEDGSVVPAALAAEKQTRKSVTKESGRVEPLESVAPKLKATASPRAELSESRPTEAKHAASVSLDGANVGQKFAHTKSESQHGLSEKISIINVKEAEANLLTAVENESSLPVHAKRLESNAAEEAKSMGPVELKEPGESAYMGSVASEDEPMELEVVDVEPLEDAPRDGPVEPILAELKPLGASLGAWDQNYEYVEPVSVYVEPSDITENTSVKSQTSTARSADSPRPSKSAYTESATKKPGSSKVEESVPANENEAFAPAAEGFESATAITDRTQWSTTYIATSQSPYEPTDLASASDFGSVDSVLSASESTDLAPIYKKASTESALIASTPTKSSSDSNVVPKGSALTVNKSIKSPAGSNVATIDSVITAAGRTELAGGYDKLPLKFAITTAEPAESLVDSVRVPLDSASVADESAESLKSLPINFALTATEPAESADFNENAPIDFALTAMEPAELPSVGAELLMDSVLTATEHTKSSSGSDVAPIDSIPTATKYAQSIGDYDKLPLKFALTAVEPAESLADSDELPLGSVTTTTDCKKSPASPDVVSLVFAIKSKESAEGCEEAPLNFAITAAEPTELPDDFDKVSSYSVLTATEPTESIKAYKKMPVNFTVATAEPTVSTATQQEVSNYFVPTTTESSASDMLPMESVTAATEPTKSAHNCKEVPVVSVTAAAKTAKLRKSPDVLPVKSALTASEFTASSSTLDEVVPVRHSQITSEFSESLVPPDALPGDLALTSDDIAEIEPMESIMAKRREMQAAHATKETKKTTSSAGKYRGLSAEVKAQNEIKTSVAPISQKTVHPKPEEKAGKSAGNAAKKTDATDGLSTARASSTGRRQSGQKPSVANFQMPTRDEFSNASSQWDDFQECGTARSFSPNASLSSNSDSVSGHLCTQVRELPAAAQNINFQKPLDDTEDLTTAQPVSDWYDQKLKKVQAQEPAYSDSEDLPTALTISYLNLPDATKSSRNENDPETRSRKNKKPKTGSSRPFGIGQAAQLPFCSGRTETQTREASAVPDKSTESVIPGTTVVLIHENSSEINEGNGR